MDKEWQELIEKYTDEVMWRWFTSYKGYISARENNTYEFICEELERLII